MTQNLTRAERLEEFKSHARARADELIAARERYKDYLSRLPAAIYNNNLDIYTAALNRMDAEIDSAIEMAEEEEKAYRLYLEQERVKSPDNDPAVLRLNKVAGYDLFGALARKSPERIKWEQEYLKKRREKTRFFFRVEGESF
ncbi:MAG: hypothetical protein ACOY4M_08235 [Pseudomonadota bacterium]